MCGIVGFASRKGYRRLERSLGRAVSTLDRRGPDEEGVYTNPAAGIGLGHRRLAVIDLSPTGRQPMHSADGAQCMVFNGEIYNFRLLRKELDKQGHVFHGSSDTEVLLAAYRQWGVDCLKRLVGMFAFAIWDERQRRLFLARDRLGIKPLYYYYREGTLMFASELKALRALEGFPACIDWEALPQFLHYQYVPAPGTIYADTRKLLPGHCALFEHGCLKVHRYWRPPAPGSNTGPCSETEALKGLSRHLARAVSQRLVSDVPLGALLSGGIDSSLVAATMTQVSPQPVKTFSIGFTESGFDEAPWARKIAHRLGTQHTELYVTPQMSLKVVPSIADIYDEPFADSSAIPTILVSRLARAHVTVALSGDGGDEQFGGYLRYAFTRAIHGCSTRLPATLARAAARLLAAVPVDLAEDGYRRIYRYLPRPLQVVNFREKWQKLVQLIGQRCLQEFYRMSICLWTSQEIKHLLGKAPTTGIFEQAFKNGRSFPAIERLMYVDQCTYLPDDLLTKVDRASMSTGLEVRVPLLDHRLLAYTAGLPARFKYRRGESKYLLRRLLRRYLPGQMFQRPKQGFGVPLADWLRSELKALLLDYLSAQRLRAEGIFDAALVTRYVEEHLTRKADHHYRLWTLLVWQMWRERWG